MGRIAKLSLIFSIFLLFSSQAVASDSYTGDAAEKFVTGIANAATGWLELPKNVILVGQKEGPVYGATVGVAMGIMHTVGRSLIGVLDIATFLIPTKSSVNPLFIWEDFSRETSY